MLFCVHTIIIATILLLSIVQQGNPGRFLKKLASAHGTGQLELALHIGSDLARTNREPWQVHPYIGRILAARVSEHGLDSRVWRL